MSVCPSIKRVNCDKTKETSAKILIPYKSSIYLVFWQEEWLVGTTPSTWNFGPNWPRRFRNADFQSISARSASAVAPSETNPVMTNKKVHYVHSSEPKVNSVRCLQAPQRGLINAKLPFLVKKCTRLEQSLLHSFIIIIIYLPKTHTTQRARRTNSIWRVRQGWCTALTVALEKK